MEVGVPRILLGVFGVLPLIFPAALPAGELSLLVPVRTSVVVAVRVSGVSVLRRVAVAASAWTLPGVRRVGVPGVPVPAGVLPVGIAIALPRRIGTGSVVVPLGEARICAMAPE